MKDYKIMGMPMPLYLIILVICCACMALGIVPKGLVPVFFVMMVLGAALDTLGKVIPVVKTYFGGSVMCIMGGAILAASGMIPQQTLESMDFLINDSGFLIFYIAALITGSLFNVDRDLLIRATGKLLPVAFISLIAGVVCSGVMGIVLGYGFWDGILFVGVPMTSGGLTAGTVPLSSIYSQVLGEDPAVLLTRMAPATVLGNIIAIVYGGLLNNYGKTHQALTGNGVLVNDGKPVKVMPAFKPSFQSLCTGLVIALAFYQGAAILHKFIPVVPTYGWMILAVVIVKAAKLLPEELEVCAREWGHFVIYTWTPVALSGLGFTLIDLNTIIKNMTPLYFLSTIIVVTVIMLVAQGVGRMVGFYPIESAIAAGLSTTNMGGSGNVAILTCSERMELLPFAQIVTRCCGAFMLTMGGILVNIIHK